MDLVTPPQSPQPNNVRVSAIARKALKRVRSPKKTFESPLEKRKPGSHSDLPLEVRQAAVAEYRAALGTRKRLSKEGVKLLHEKFRAYNIDPSSIRRWHHQQLDAEAKGADPVKARRSLASKRIGRAATNTKLTVPIARAILEINAKHWGRLSNKKLLGKVQKELPEHDIKCEESMRSWCKALGAKKHWRYIKPLLRLGHKVKRLRWAINEIDGDGMLSDHKDTVHADEKWFFMMHDGSVCRVFPDEHGKYTMPKPPRLTHKSRTPKLMFLVANARPRPEYNFDGKIGIWYFANVRKAKRSHKATGTVKGVTDIMETYTVDAKVYRQHITGKGGVMEAIREKMWWYKKGSGKPEAGQEIWLQHDGARPHTAKVNETEYKKNRSKHGFIITVCQQAPQSPDVNIEDIAFFNSLQSDTSCVSMSNLFELRDAVNKCYEEYPTERLEACWRILNINLRGILESEGDNDYKTHVGDRKRATKGLEEDRKVPAEVIKKARRAFKKMYAQWNKENPDKDIDDASEPESSESEDD